MAARVVRWLGGIILFAAGASVILWQFGHFAMRGYRIPSSAMEPTLHCARPGSGCEADTMDRILVPRFHPFWSPSRGDVVVFKTPPATVQKCGAGGTFVKRLVGLPGETWEQRKGVVYIDGARLDEPYLAPDRRDRSTHPARPIPEGTYFVLGDNRSRSCDSREWGAVPRENIIGPVVLIGWPPDRIGSP